MTDQTDEMRAEHPGGTDDQKLYLVEIAYIGPDWASKGRHAHKVRVLREPGRKNVSGEPCVKGWLGTTDDWHKTALGEFTADEARQYLADVYGITNVSSVEPGEDIFLT